MRWTKIILAASLAMSAAAPAVAGHDRPVASTRDAQLAEWLRDRARIGAKLPYLANAELESWGVYVDVVDAGDLDGDGRSDVLDLRTHVEYDDELGILETLRIDAYRGTDGKVLWTHAFPRTNYTFPVVTKVGADGKPGVVVITHTGAGSGAAAAGAGGGSVTVTSIDRAGALLWSRPLAGGGAGSVAHYTDTYTGVDGFFDAVAGGGTDLLVRTVVAVGGGDPTGAVDEARTAAEFSVLDGATGALRPVGEPVVSFWGSYGTTAGDLDGDKLADFAIEGDVEGEAVIKAMSSATGKVLWALPVTEDTYVGALPDVTGDGTADLEIRAYEMGPIVIGPSPPGHFPSEPKVEVGVLDGKRGKLVWRKSGWYLRALGDVDRKRGSEVVVGDSVGGTSVGFTIGAYNGSGRRLWSATRKLPRPAGDSRGVTYTNSWGTVGDTGADGVEEIGFAIVTTDGGKTRRDEGTIDGRTGRVRKDPAPGMWATRAALDGRGADAFTATSARGVFTIDAWRGDAPSRLWTTAVRASGSYLHSDALSVDGDRCGDLAATLAVDDQTYTTIVYSGSAGRPLWHLVRTGLADAKVAQPSVAKQKTYRRGC